MRLLWVYLAVYLALVAGAGLILGQAGLLEDLPPAWTAVGLLAVVGLAILLAIVSPPRRTRPSRPE